MNDKTEGRSNGSGASRPLPPPHNDNAKAVREQSERLKALLDDLNRPLDEVDWSHTSLRGEKGEQPKSFLKRIRREREHRRELHRARRAASSAFKVKPKRSTRKKATIMLSAGAVGLAAFTGPPVARQALTSSSAAQKVVDDMEGVRKPAALLKASDDFKQALIEEEGVRYTVYRDVAGYPTVGVGHLVSEEDGLRVGDRVTEDEVMDFLDADLIQAEHGVRALVRDLPLHQHEFDALLDLVYNVGFGNVSPSESPRLNAAIDAADYEGIAEELDYTTAGGRFAKGLEFRSDRRAKIFMDAAYDNPRDIPSDGTA